MTCCNRHSEKYHAVKILAEDRETQRKKTNLLYRRRHLKIKKKLAYFCCAYQEHFPVTSNKLDSAKRCL